MTTTSTPLIDRAAITALGEGMDPAVLADFLGSALAEAELAHAALEAGATRDEVMQLAHRLRGTSGMFGLTRIAELGGLIEAVAERGEGMGEGMGELVRALGQAVAASRAEIAALAGQD